MVQDLLDAIENFKAENAHLKAQLQNLKRDRNRDEDASHIRNTLLSLDRVYQHRMEPHVAGVLCMVDEATRTFPKY